jgi:hypothetical protein
MKKCRCKHYAESLVLQTTAVPTYRTQQVTLYMQKYDIFGT